MQPENSGQTREVHALRGVATPRKNLEQYFHFSEFRPGQEEIITSILSGRDVIAILPTGGGKSLCYQLPAVMSEKLTVVVSPLIALMKDQVDALEVRGIRATYINASLDRDEAAKSLSDVSDGAVRILYIAPERFASADFRRLFEAWDVGLFAVDEAHCVSQWGHDFRPDYRLLATHIAKLRQRPVVAAFTATATEEVKQDIVKGLGLIDPKVHVRGFDRPNLYFFARPKLKQHERLEEVVRLVKSTPGAGIVYALTRKETEEAAAYLRQHGIAAASYHAGLDKSDRTHVQERFMENEFRVVVATVAFGMGIDKADIRFVIHAGMPPTLEGYYQEAGRAGRDGEKAYCVLLHSGKDTSLHHFFINKSRIDMQKSGKSRDEIARALDIKYRQLQSMESYLNTSGCRRRVILEYFGDPAAADMTGSCQGCDMCLRYQWQPATPGIVQAKKEAGKNGLTDTVRETVKLYRAGTAPPGIAKIRSLGVSTVFGHLLTWYVHGGDFRIEEHISQEQERLILAAMARCEDYTRLGHIKAELPEEISYEHIRMVIAKIKRMRL